MQIKEIVTINGTYPPTFDGIRSAIEACSYDQELGETEANTSLLFVYEDGGQELVFVGNGFPDEDYEATDIAHRFNIEHDRSLCLECAMEDDLAIGRF